MNDWQEPISDEIPPTLPERWIRRDLLYRRRLEPLNQPQIAAVRAWREGEAEDEGNRELVLAARKWRL